jgi:hypothetical protein
MASMGNPQAGGREPHSWAAASVRSSLLGLAITATSNTGSEALSSSSPLHHQKNISGGPRCRSRLLAGDAAMAQGCVDTAR